MQDDYIFEFIKNLADNASNVSKSYFKKELILENKAKLIKKLSSLLER
jgi:hypothetical protein